MRTFLDRFCEYVKSPEGLTLKEVSFKIQADKETVFVLTDGGVPADADHNGRPSCQ